MAMAIHGMTIRSLWVNIAIVNKSSVINEDRAEHNLTKPDCRFIMTGTTMNQLECLSCWFLGGTFFFATACADLNVVQYNAAV